MKDYQSRLVIHKLGGIPPLLELLKSDFPVLQHLALNTLECVTTDKDTRRTFWEEKGFEKLIDVLNNMVGVCVAERCFLHQYRHCYFMITKQEMIWRYG